MSTPILKNKSILELASKVGSFIEYWGFKQVHGKIWTLVFLSPEPVDANFLKDSLGISKALASMSIKDLIDYNVIFEVKKDRPGTQKYAINPNITQVILDIIKVRELEMIQEIEDDCQTLKKQNKKWEDSVSADRMTELTFMVETAHALLKGMIMGQEVDFEKFDQVMNVKD